MEKNISSAEIKKKIKSSLFVLNCEMQMGYSIGKPVLQIKNGSLCLLYPFLKYKKTGIVDKTEVYPVRYTVTAALPSGKPVGFSNLEYDERFEDVDFDKPVGYFRHEAVRHLTKTEYMELADELDGLYDKVIDMLLNGTPYSEKDEERMAQLLKLLTEPEIKPFYERLDRDFYEKYLA